MPILERVRHEIQRHSMLLPGDRVIVAVSGGPDSVTLVHLLHRLAPEWQVALHLFHMDHGLRGAASAADAAYVAALAEQLGLPLAVVALPPGELKREPGSLQANARRRRYAEIHRLAASLGAARVATGHNRDDQAETVLMRMIRGTGSKGLAGIPPVRAEGGLTIIRPLLTIARSDIEQYCREHKLNPRLDASNAQADYLRNRIRLELLPLLSREYNPAVAENLSQLAEVVREEDAILERLAQESYERCRLDREEGQSGDVVLLDGPRLLAEPLGIARRVIRLVARRILGPGTELGLQTVARACELAGRTDGTHLLHLQNGIRLTVEYGRCRFERAGSAVSVETGSSMARWQVAGRGETVIPGLGLIISAEPLAAVPAPAVAPPGEIWLDQDRLPGPLAVRFRLPGDRIWPIGMEGSKKLQDILVDAKVPRGQRDQIPLLVAGDAILWIPGLRKDRRFLAGPATTRPLRLAFRPIETEELQSIGTASWRIQSGCRGS